MRGLIASVALTLLAGCADDEENSHTRVAKCLSQRVLAQSSPGQPEGQWPKYIDVMAVDNCTGEVYGALVEEQLAANPDDRDDLESRFISFRVIDVLKVADHPMECMDLLACATGNMRYNTYGDCLTMSAEPHAQDEAENLLGCDGSLSDQTTQVVCAEFVRSALMTTMELCY